MVLGTLIYAAVIGFFNDYTDILTTVSFSWTFAMAFVLQVLTTLTLMLKRWVAARFKGREGLGSTIGLGFSVWLIMFLSKFVFLAVVEVLLGHAVDVSGFIGIMLIVATMMVLQQVVRRTYQWLGDR